MKQSSQMLFVIGSLSSISIKVLKADKHKTWDFVWRSTSQSWAFCVKSVTVRVFFMKIFTNSQYCTAVLLKRKNRRLHRCLKLTSREKAKINSWKRRALCDLVLSYERNEIWSIYNDNYFEISTNLHVKSIELTHILCFCCGFRRSLPF